MRLNTYCDGLSVMLGLKAVGGDPIQIPERYFQKIHRAGLCPFLTCTHKQIKIRTGIHFMCLPVFHSLVHIGREQ